jgi:hypothetical protein
MGAGLHSIENALAEAIRDPGARPEFHRLLLDSDVYVVTANSQEELRKGSLGSVALKLVLYESSGEMIVPFYTSAEKLEAVLKQHPGWVRLNARDFFRMVSKAKSVLNAGHAQQWTFCPSDVAALLERPVVNAVVLDPMESELLPPSRDAVPETVLAALRSFYAKHAGIRAAYVLVGRARAAGSDDQALVVIEMDVAEGLSEVVEGTPIVLQQTEGARRNLFNLVTLVPGEITPVRKFIESVAPSPFYRRAGEGLAAARGRRDRTQQN